jgi:uncharacterized Ntn-hydrolase superfamily protein
MSTISIVGYDPNNGELGVAVHSRFLAVGALVPVGNGARRRCGNAGQNPICTTGSNLAKIGKRVRTSTAFLTEVNSRRRRYQRRQIGILNAQGRGAALHGKACLPWAGSSVGATFCCPGQCLSGPDVLDAMADTYTRTEGDLAYKLLQALEAAQYYGGDRRGQQKRGPPWLKVRKCNQSAIQINS